MIFVNFKTYEQGTGSRAIDLVKTLVGVAESFHIKIIPVLQATDIKEATLSSKLEIWSQKVDPQEFGAHTGAILPEAVYEDGAVGTFLNHSEAKMPIENLKAAQKRAALIGIKTLIFAADLKELETILDLAPTYAAYEPPELIGSASASVATSQPEIISQAAILSKNKGIPLIVGAGIHSGQDVRKSLELGAVGVAVSSDIVKAQDPKTEIIDLLEGFSS